MAKKKSKAKKKPAKPTRRRSNPNISDYGDESALVIFNLRIHPNLLERIDVLTRRLGLGKAMRARIARRSMAHGVEALEKNMDLLHRWGDGR